MSLKRLFVQTDDAPQPSGGKRKAKAEAVIAGLSTAELREWIDQYMYVIGRSLSEYSKNPTAKGYLDEAVEAARLLNICMQRLAGRL
mgnify:CR=1 FL=1